MRTATRRTRCGAGRYSNAIGAGEWKQLDQHYERFQAAAQKATQVNPQDSFAWSTLAEGRDFQRRPPRSPSPLWKKAIALDPNNGSAWRWGLQLSQEKWFGSDKQFIAFVQRAAGHADAFAFPADDVGAVYARLKMRGPLKAVYQTVVAKDPTNVEALTELGGIYHYEDRSYKKAESLYRQALKVNPRHARALSMLGDLTYWVHSDPKGAEALYKRAIAADPKDGYFHANLGRMYALTGRKAQGAAEANAAKKLGFNDRSHDVWNATGVTPPSRF